MDEPKIALGAMEFGTRIDDKTSFALLDQYVDAGGVWIDTADCYAFWGDPSGHGGQSEALIGRWLAARPGVRERVQISTKVGCEPTSPGSFPEASEGLSRKAIDAALAGSLRRMGIEHVELYWAHRDDRGTPLEETVAAFGAHVADGTVGRVGLSNYALWRTERARGIAAALGYAPPTALQLRYSYPQPRPLVRDNVHVHRFGWITDEVLDYAATDATMELWAYSPLEAGAFERADRPLHEAFDHPGTTRRLAALEEAAAELRVSRSALVVAWMTGATPFVRPIIGASTPAQLASAIEGARLTLAADVREALDRPW
ncbi:aldo/keto reductase [Streptomyces sp. N2-109]|uniref:Aldo/keto reductase n=1 Tax=Streptomyces gossypii TaxID=2883101 RepID=A0ABT2JV22_9ACTN|nr:aldo/keto reductase [Streptomyces gossypii]MCT2591747.1 aldo/keto reductase [Streptomyces gossypii]